MNPSLFLGVCCGCLSVVHSAIINSPSAATQLGGSGASPYRSWSDVPDSIVRYKIATGANTYTAPELVAIRAAMDQIEFDSGNCVKFLSAAANYQAGPWLNIVPRANPLIPEKSCRGSPGFQPNSQQNTMGQLLVLYSSANPNAGNTTVGACLDDLRDAMRLLVNSIGLLNEWRHSKRDTFMSFPRNRNRLVDPDYQEFMVFDPSRLYVDATVTDTDTSTFDSQSITMISPARYAATARNPTFRLRADLPDVPSEARMSYDDCTSIQNDLFNGRCQTNVRDCESVDPYNTDFAAARFFPTNKINRPVQCQRSDVITPNPIVLGELLISGVPVVAPLTGTTLTLKNTALLTQLGVKAVLSVRKGMIQTPGTVAAACTAPDIATGCQYSVRFELSKLPDMNGVGSFENQNIIVVLNRGGQVLESLTATLSINCAPIFRKLVANVGPNPILAAEKVYQFPNEIKAVTPPANTGNVNMASAIVQAKNAGQLAQFVVNYNVPMGVGEKGSAVGDTQENSPTKVFVNCNTGFGDTTPGPTTTPVTTTLAPTTTPVPTTATAIPTTNTDSATTVVTTTPVPTTSTAAVTTTGPTTTAGIPNPGQRLAGTTVIGVVQAVDPEGDEVSYYALSTDTRVTGAAGSAMTATGELHTVSKDGVISVSGFVDPVEGAGVTGDGAGNVGIGVTPNSPAAGMHSGAATVSPDVARTVLIGATDKKGARSVLLVRYYLACGQPLARK